MSNDIDVIHTSRRRLIGAAALAGSGFALTASLVRPALAQDEDEVDTPPEEPAEESSQSIGQAGPPAWLFTVINLYDPYEGEVEQQDDVPDGSRVVTALVQIDNDSDQAVEISPYYFRFRDTDGTDYQGGYVAGDGSIPHLSQRYLNPGERGRGWIWAAVPEDASLVEIVFGAPGPQFRVRLPSADA